jgi:membrane-bound lytic murein transglycosylase B
MNTVPSETRPGVVLLRNSTGGAVIVTITGAALGTYAFDETGAGQAQDDPDDEAPVTEASPPAPAPAYSDAVMARVACIEEKESRGLNIANLRGSGAVGVMQFMPQTFYAHAAELGHVDWSPWSPTQARVVAAHDLTLGRRSQWTVSGC